MAGPFKVRLEDGMEVGPLDGEMLRSWFQQGLIGPDTEIRAKNSKRWVRLADTFETGDWGGASSSGGSGRGRGRPADEDLEGLDTDDSGFEAAGPQTWRTYVACALFFVLALGAGYFFLFPSVFRALPGAPWREIALGFVVLGLLLVRGWEPMRKLARALVLLLTLALFPLAEVMIFHGVPWRSLIVLIPAVVLGFALFFFLSGRYKTWPRVVANLFFVAVGAAGVVMLGAFPPPAVAAWMAAPSPLPAILAPAMVTGSGAPAAAAPPATMAVAPPPVTTAPMAPAATTSAAPVPEGAPAAAVVLQEVPLLAPRAAEVVRARAVFAPEDAFRRSYELAGNGVAALDAAERRDLGELMAAAYGTIPAADRRRLEAYMAGIRGGQISTSEQNREMSALMRGAVLKLPDGQRSRLQALYEKAILAAR
jgi:hypothetical protein